jgi:hypothetical protein
MQFSKRRIDRMPSLKQTMPFMCASSASFAADAVTAAREAFQQVKKELVGQTPTVLIVNCTSNYDIPVLVAELNALSGDKCLVHGGTTCRGVMMKRVS